MNGNVTIVADLLTGKATTERVWDAGDIDTTAATVIMAVGAGRMAANLMKASCGLFECPIHSQVVLFFVAQEASPGTGKTLLQF